HKCRTANKARIIAALPALKHHDEGRISQQGYERQSRRIVTTAAGAHPAKGGELNQPASYVESAPDHDCNYEQRRHRCSAVAQHRGRSAPSDRSPRTGYAL